MTWPDAYAILGITPADVRLWRVVLLHPPALSPVARALVEGAPPAFWQGQVVPLRQLAAATCYSVGYIHAALQELRDAGYVRTIPYGQRRCRYCGNPQRRRAA